MTDETRELRNGLHRQQRRRAWLGGAAAILIGVLVGGTGTALVQAVNREEEKAEQAVSAVDQLCGQVRALGGVCVVDPADLRGEPGPQGPPPTDEQVLRAVETYLRANPPEPGRPPTMQEIADAVAIQLAVDPPERGERGPGPTPQQIADAVATFLLANPPPPGEDGEAGEDGEDGADSTVPGPPGEPPLSWTFETCDVIGKCTTHRCERDEPFDPEAPRYTCKAEEEDHE